MVRDQIKEKHDLKSIHYYTLGCLHQFGVPGTSRESLMIIIDQNAYCSLDIYLQCMKYLRSVTLPRRRVSLVKINVRFFPKGNMTSLINLNKAEHRNNELSVVLLLLSLSLFTPLKSEFSSSPTEIKGRGGG